MAIFTNQATLIYNGQATSSNVTTGEILDALEMTKIAVGNGYNVGERVTYVINIINTGGAIANAVLTDDLGAYAVGQNTVRPLNYINGSILLYRNGTPAPAPAVTATDPLTVSGIDIGAGENIIIIYDAEVNEFAPLALGATITNTAELNAPGVTLTASATVDVRGDVRLTIAKAMSPQTVTDNGDLTYTFIIQNAGNTAVVATDNVIVTDTFNPALGSINVTYNGDVWNEGVEYTYNEATGEFATVAGYITVPAATYTQDPVSGAIGVTPGVAVITVRGNVIQA